jgi:sialic acid synthase SpsE
MQKRVFQAGGTAFRAFERVMVIAEIGTGHNGSLEKAKELVDAAQESGADAAKFQIVYADEILHPDTGSVNLPGGPVRLYDRFRALEVSPDFYAEIADYCRQKGLIFLASPFGLKSLTELDRLKPAAIKIASPELNHFPLLRAASRLSRPLILSSGVSTLADIERALEATASVQERVLLHCVTSYPAPEEEYNLVVLESLSAIFGIPVGVSDHSLDPVLVPLLAVASGAIAIEKHICLSKADPGLDDPVALEPEAFARMTRAVREALSGKSDAPSVKSGIIKGLSGEYGKERIDAILGSGVKALAPSERANYSRTNRSIHYVRDMAPGAVIAEGDVAILRTEKVLTTGLSPEWLDAIVGARLARGVTAGAGVTWEDVVSRPAPR